MNEKSYPVSKLNANINIFLNQIVSAGIAGAIDSGLQNEIRIIDEGGHISEISSIGKDSISKKSIVRLSNAYCQFYWLVCDVALKILDRNVLIEECNNNHISPTQMIESTREAIKLTTTQISQRLPSSYQGNVNQFVSYLQLTPDLLDDDFLKNIQKEFTLAMQIADNDATIDFSLLQQVDINGKYGERTNSIYCYGIAFLLLHELAHHQFEHLETEGSMEEEEEADQVAFWDIFSDIQGEARFSAQAAMICVFFSFMMLDPLMTDDTHPNDYKRLFYIYDQIKDENTKYTDLVIGLFDFWAKIYNIAGYPLDLPRNEESITIIKSFFENNAK